MITTPGEKIVELKNRIVEEFNVGHWNEIGLLTECSSIIDNHPRLLRSLSFNDDDYPGNVLTVLRYIIDKDPKNYRIISTFLDDKFGQTSEYISAEPSERKITFAPNVFKIPDDNIDTKLISIMMPFAMEFDIVNSAIKETAKSCGFTCLRVDDIWEEATIIQDIFNLIFRSFIVIVDFSGKNANVMYETGIAHALGKHVIPISQSLEDIPFDMRHHRVLNYLKNEEGIRKLKSELASKLQQY